MPLPPRARLRVTGTAAAATLVLLGMAWGFLALLGMSPRTGLAFAAVIAGLNASYVAVHLATVTSGWFPAAARTWLLAAVWSAEIGVAAAAITTALVGSPAAIPVLVGLGTFAVALPIVHRPATAGVTSDSPFPSQVRSLREADAAAAVRAMEVRLRQPRLTPVQRASAEIQRCDGLTALAFHAGRPDRLTEVTALLERIALDPTLTHPVRAMAAFHLVEARSVQAEITWDDHGWLAALHLQEAIAGESDADPAERARALFDWADHQVYLTSTATVRGEDALEPARRAYDLFRRSLAAFDDGSAFVPMVRLRIAQQAFSLALLDPAGRPMSVGDEIRELRAVLPLFRGAAGESRQLARMTLARLLLLEADEEERITPGLAEAEKIGAALLADRRIREIAGSAHEILAEAARLRLELTPQPDPEQVRELSAVRVEHLRAAFEANAALSFGGAAASGLEWGRAVAAGGDIGAAADAYAQLVRQVGVETLRRLAHRDRAVFVKNFQGTATEAGRALATARRLGEAVEAIEGARAILLGQRAARLPADLAGTLARAGHSELHGRYVTAAQELGRQERALYAVADRAAAHRARGAFDEVRREVVATVGDVGGRGVDAARAIAPAVYLAAAEPAGYAVVVAADGVMTLRDLPLATPDAVATQIAAYRLVQTGDAPAAGDGSLNAVLAWAWKAVMAPIIALLPPDVPVTLVPLGGLGLLPLHAAGAGADRVDDLVTVRYAPSARMAAQARRDATAAELRAPSLLVVGAAVVPGAAPLPFVEVETATIGGRAPSVVLAAATRAAVLDALAPATSWHLACHGTADVLDPLDSRLELTDKPLTVRDILALPTGAYRIAVLSACQSAVPDADRLDEVIGLPGALLQAGVAGVVASGWPVSDEAAAAYTIRLHQLLGEGIDPAEAVRRTGAWLRTATRGELQDRLGPGFTTERRSGRPFAHPHFWAAFSLTGV